MRADRLLAILLLLQGGGRLTAGEVARRLEVSQRTIYRDLEALGAAGVPVYAEPGRNGGIRLLKDYRTDLTGLTHTEAELVPLIGLAGVLSGIGVGSSLRNTETKLLMALPKEQRRRAEDARRRVYVDLSRWWETNEVVPQLATVAESVLARRGLRVTYGRGEDGTEVRRTLDPLGLVVQGGTWYLVARTGADPRIYRVSRISSAELLETRVEIPTDFDLETFWAGRKEEFHMTRAGYRVVVRARPRAVRALTEGRHRATIVDPPASHDDWTTLELSIETRRAAFQRLLGLADDVVVVEPEELRDQIAAAIGRMQSLYA